MINEKEILSISFMGGELNIQIKLSDNFQIPKESELKLISADIFGTKAVEIILGTSGEFLTNFDTLTINDASATYLDTTITIINSTLEQIKDMLPQLLNEEKIKE